MERIGFFGGSFNPVHLGHTVLVKKLKDDLQLNRVEIILNGNPPHKTVPGASYNDRFTMLRLAFDSCPFVHINQCERDSAFVHYTYDTLREFRNFYGQNTALFFMMGYDSLCSLDTWKNGFSLTDYAHLAVISRPQYNPELLPFSVKHFLKDRLITETTSKEAIKALNTPSGNVFWIDSRELDISSTRLRTIIHEGYGTPEIFEAKLQPFIDEKVIEYIKHHHLYSLI